MAPIITGRNAVQNIGTPLISNSKTRYANYLKNVTEGKVRLNRRHKDIIQKIPSVGDWAYFSDDKANIEDLAALTCATKHEFALFTGGGRALVIHGGTRWNIPESAWSEIKSQQLYWVGHSHPTTVNLQASKEDRDSLRYFFTWQKESTIIDMTGEIILFDGDEQNWFNQILGVK